ncbi:centrosomal protein of 83 kDa-like [Genypterus blacodes]|uniref:centrosomal protein of 83 kDa-like n=1 Tax=Genypterus blacodes TaxID=154954 RepID=UPI003F769E05
MRACVRVRVCIGQVMTPQWLELLRAQVQQEMEAPVRERFNMLEEETEKYRNDYYKLRYEYTLLKSQFDHQREEHARTLEEQRIRVEAEVSRLERHKVDLVAQYQGSDPLNDGKQLEALVREKAQLHLRLKGLEAEVAELRAQKENSGQQAENVQRIQIRQLTESQAMVKSLEAERQSLRLQLERLENELRLSHEQNSQLSGKVHKAEREVNSLNCQIESLKHSRKIEVANVKLECARSKGELERERETLQGQIDGMDDTDTHAHQWIPTLPVSLCIEKLPAFLSFLCFNERELVRKVQCAREEEFHKTATLHEEKLELENCLASLEQQRMLQEAAGSSQKEEWEARLRSAQQGEESAHRELHTLRAKLQQQGSQLEEFERQKAEIADLKQKTQEFSVQLGTLSHTESDLLETNGRLRETLDRVREDLRSVRGHADKSQHEAERLVEDHQIEWLEGKCKLQERAAELQHKYSLTVDILQGAALAQNKREMWAENKDKRLQDKVQLLEAKIVGLELEATAAKKRTSSSEEQAQLIRRLKDLQRRHKEFRHLLLGGQGPLDIGTTFLTSSPTAMLIPGYEGVVASVHEEQGALSELHQRQQMEQLDSLVQRGVGCRLPLHSLISDPLLHPFSNNFPSNLQLSDT